MSKETNATFRVAALSVALTLFGAAQAQYVQQGYKLIREAPTVQFGRFVALSADGNAALTGASNPNNGWSGFMLFTRSNGFWTGGTYFWSGIINDATYFGASLALSGDGKTALIGATTDNNGVGAAWVFNHDGVWTPGGKLVGSGSVASRSGGVYEGNAVALSADGNTALIGGPHDNNMGALWVFTRSNGVWTQQGSKLVVSGSCCLGLSVALSADGNTALAGDPGGMDIGGAWVFTRSNGVWTQQGGRLVGSEPTWPPAQGESLALSADGNTALVGGGSSWVNAAWVFARNSGVWTQQGSMLTGSGFSSFGDSLALSADGNAAFIGAPGDNNGVGAVYVFTRSNGVWTQQNKLVGAAYVSSQDGVGEGSSVAVSADASTVLIGGPGDNGGSGGAWVFVRPALALGASSIVLGSAAGSSSIMVGSNPPGSPLSWTASTTAPWIHLGMSSGTAGSPVAFTVDANAGPTRTGTISFNNGAALLTVTQAGSTYVPASQMTTLISSGLKSPSGVAVDASGNLYIADTLNYAVKKWTSGTQQLTILDSASLTPRGVALDVSGNVYIAETQQNSIRKWAPDTQQDSTLISSGLNSPSGVAVDAAGNVYIADSGNNAVKEWPVTTQQVTILDAAALTPKGVAVDVAGNVYIANTANNAIKEWAPGTTQETTLISSGLNSPSGVAADGSGNLYIADTLNNAIKKWTANTQVVTTLVSTGLNEPNGVAVDASGNVYIADTGNNAIKVIWSAYLDASPITVPAAAGSGSLPAVLPPTTPLNAQSDQTWLIITSQVNGVVSFSYTANPGSTSRMAHLNVLGQSITVTQTAAPVLLPALGIAKTHYGSFTQGQQNATYTVTVSNAANAGPTIGTVTVTENVPAGLTLVSMAGAAWACPGTAANNCTRSDALNAGASYPPITVTVNVTSNASSPQVNSVSVSGGASATANATDPTMIGTVASVSCVRDFRAIGHSDALLYDPNDGTTYTALSNGNGTYKYVYNLFTPAFDTLRTGDFNGDGKADMVVYNSHTALAYIGMSNGDGTFAFQSLFWSPGYDFVEAGDLNGDGKTDFALYNSLTGTLYTGIGNGNGTFTYKYTLLSKGYTFLRLADFTGDGKADLFAYNAATGAAHLGIGDGTGGFAFHPLFLSPGYNLADVGDLNGDGKADLILYNSVNGNAATGTSDGAGGFTFTSMLFSPGFSSVRLADYTGDGKADVTVYNKTTAAAYFGIGTGLGTFNFQSLFWSPNYAAVEPQDANGDGKIDVVLYNATTGTEYTGISNGNGTFTYTYSLWGMGKMLAR